MEKISLSGCVCDSSASSIISLREAGASDEVILAVIDPRRAGRVEAFSPQTENPSQEPCSPPVRALPELLRPGMLPDLSFPKSKYVSQSGDDEVKADLLFTDISIVVQERNESFIFATIPYDSIVSVSYERSAHPRVKTAIFFSPFWLLSKSKKHWLIVNYSKCVFR